MITHVVTFKFRDGSRAHLDHCTALIESMRDRVPSLRSLTVGRNVVDVPNAHHLVLIATFDDVVGLEEYQEHPVHTEVVAYLRQHREASASVDYES